MPKGFDMKHSRDTFAGWLKLGVHPVDGKKFPNDGRGILFFPAGAKAPPSSPPTITPCSRSTITPMPMRSRSAISPTSCSGGSPIQAKWPADDRQLSRDARIALQKKLAALGYKVHDFEGHIDFDLRDNIRAEQVKFGMVPDGNPTPSLLDRLGVKCAVNRPRPVLAAVRSRHVAGGVFGFEPDHLEQIAESVEPGMARHVGEVGRHARHIDRDLCPVVRSPLEQDDWALYFHCDP